MFGSFDFQEFLSAFIVLFAVIDIIGSIPIILNLKQKGRNVNANKATFISFALLLGFFYAGDMMLKLFQVDIASFAVAGAFVIFLMIMICLRLIDYTFFAFLRKYDTYFSLFACSAIPKRTAGFEYQKIIFQTHL